MKTKVCCTCKLRKDIDDFHLRNDKPGGRVGRCKPCQSEYHRNWYNSNKKRVNDNTRRNRYLRAFNMTIAEYEILLVSQNNCCAICKTKTNTSNKRFSIDHDHQTGAVRGLLCDPCNTGLGMFRDNPGLLTEAINYLSR